MDSQEAGTRKILHLNLGRFLPPGGRIRKSFDFSQRFVDYARRFLRRPKGVYHALFAIVANHPAFFCSSPKNSDDCPVVRWFLRNRNHFGDRFAVDSLASVTDCMELETHEVLRWQSRKTPPQIRPLFLSRSQFSANCASHFHVPASLITISSVTADQWTPPLSSEDFTNNLFRAASSFLSVRL